MNDQDHDSSDANGIRLKFPGHILLSFEEFNPWQMLGDTPENIPKDDRVIRCTMTSVDKHTKWFTIAAESQIFNILNQASVDEAHDIIGRMVGRICVSRMEELNMITKSTPKA